MAAAAAKGGKAPVVSISESVAPSMDKSPTSSGAAKRSFGGLYNAVSVQAQLDLNDIPELANEPGPGHYFGPESQGFHSIGEQKFSKCMSAPEVSFPKTGWDQWEKVLISKTHSSAFLLRESPGAVYDVGSELSKKSAKIGTSLRPDLSLSLGVDPAGSPGPTYNLRDAPPLGQKHQCKNRSFGLSGRFGENRNLQNVGPGQYVRKDVALHSHTGKSFGIGRRAYDKVIRPGWEREGQCKQSLGVGPPLWTDPLTDSHNVSAFTMGRAERFTRSDREIGAPGPGAYDQTERKMSRTAKIIGSSSSTGTSVCRQVISGERTPSSVAFGSQPKKPRFRHLLAQNTAKHGAWGYF